MKKTIDLNSTDWCEVVFEGKNKEYGAYAMRQTSSRRHIMAFGITTIAVAVVALLPNILEKVKSTVNINEGTTTVHVMNEIEVKEEKVLDIPKLATPPAQNIRNSIKVTPPVITKDDQVGDGDMKSMDEILADPKIAIGYVDRMDGTNDTNAELARNLLPKGTGEGGGESGGSANTIFKTAEVMPQFPGGIADMYKYIGDNLKYPAIDQEMGTQGRVIIQFVVGIAGEIKDVKVMRGVSVNCDKEALRVIKSMPRWIPGRQNGNPVQVYFTLPIQFKLK